MIPIASAVDTEFVEGNYTYTVSDDCAKIVSFPETMSGEITIPSTLGGYKVTEIGAYAFYACTTLTKVIIPNTVKTIGNYAFAYCVELEYIKIPSSVTSIGVNAFRASNKIVIHCPSGSVAAEYAKKYGYSSVETVATDRNVIGVFEDYYISVILNGDESWISDIIISGVEYEVKQNLLPFKSSSIYDDYIGKEVFVKLSDEKVIDLLFTDTDTDSDGLYDFWEKYGADYNKDGIVDLPINEMGATVDTKDIYVEVDCMDGFNATTQEYFDKVAVEYAAHSIRLHIDAGENYTDYVTGVMWSEYPSGSGASIIPYVSEFDSFDRIEEIANENFTVNRRSVFHYCAFVENLGGAGGTAYLNHQLFTVLATMSDRSKGASFMHELGHNLGLRHGGSDSLNNKPNYLSNMNYLFAYSDDLAYKYSDYKLPNIDENSLNEKIGVDPEGLTAKDNLHTALMVDGHPQFIIAAKTPLDYNGDGDTNDVGIKVDLSNRSQATSSDTSISYDVLESQNDWLVLKLKAESIGEFSNITNDLTFENDGTKITPDEPKLEDLAEKGLFPKEEIPKTSDNCSCRCHKDGFFAKLIWNIINFFNKIMRKDEICSCGIAHY